MNDSERNEIIKYLKIILETNDIELIKLMIESIIEKLEQSENI